MTSQWHLNGASTPPLAVQVIRGEVFGTMITYPATLVWPLTLVAGLALVVWYLPVRRWIGPAALAVAGLIWLALLGVLTAWVAPGASHLLVLPLLVAAAGGLVALLLPRRSRWPVVVLTIGTVPAIVLLMPIGVGTFVSSGLPLGGASAAILVLFELVLLPVLELLFPPPQQPLGRRRAVLVPMTGILLVAA